MKGSDSARLTNRITPSWEWRSLPLEPQLSPRQSPLPSENASASIQPLVLTSDAEMGVRLSIPRYPYSNPQEIDFMIQPFKGNTHGLKSWLSKSGRSKSS